MKKLILFGLCAMTLMGCKQDKPKVDKAVVVEQRDSLNQIIAQKNNELNDMMGTLNDIEEGFRQINEAEDRVSIAKDGEGSNSADRIRENMKLKKQKLQP